ncbi:hypothetical protein ABQD61_00160 [Enterococcus asini]|uniref:hypothetical protein n=1 Tax=Enterococcus asini TaxID=57732 RepID=UPI0032E44D33
MNWRKSCSGFLFLKETPVKSLVKTVKKAAMKDYNCEVFVMKTIQQIKNDQEKNPKKAVFTFS